MNLYADIKETIVIPYRILLADDQEMFRYGIKNIVNQIENIDVCGEASNGKELTQLLDESDPNLIIMEIDLPKMNKFEIIKQLKKDNPQLKILILSHSKKREFISLTLNQGVDGYLLKEDPCQELIRAVEVIRNGGKFFSALLSSEIINIVRIKTPFFTKREQQVLELIAEGIGSRKIAESLNISICTVHRHCHNIKKKLNIKRKKDLIKYCMLHIS